jgi:ribulose-bisphosphate carboxylase large chain
MSKQRIQAVYRVCGGERDAHAMARAIAYEQTVELPEALVTDPGILADVVGAVEAVEPDASLPGAHRITIGYSPALANGQLPQLLNLLFGNVSMYSGVRLLDVRLPESFLEHLQGPRYGVEGLRKMLGVHGRPLLATALKPRGTPVEELARMAAEFALGGGDIVKDDQNLVDDDFEAFKLRVQACHRAVADANAATGRRCLYLPHVAAPANELERYFEYLHWLGAPGVLVCPMIMGLDTARALAREHQLLLMAHPALSGSYTNGDSQGMEHGVLLGTLFRLMGADISIFPNVGGRFAITAGDCAGIRDRLRAPLGDLPTAWPCPAGGMHLSNLEAMARDYGADSVFLVGGALLGHSEKLRSRTSAFLDEIRRHFHERLEMPAQDSQSDHQLTEAVVRHLRFEDGFQWSNRESTPYKDAHDLAFKGVRRVELVGKFGERTRCDLRYFEVAPGGFTSLEKHLHTHIIIGARGTGVLTMGNQRMVLAPMDVVYLQQLEVHQLHNETQAPFGFLCIVDHQRDRPMKP